MPDTPDLTPPPEQPMPEEGRAHIRRQLAAAAAGGDTDHGGRGIAVRFGRWTTPVVAAAAVVAVVLGAFAVRATQDNTSGPGRGSLQPAGTSTGAPDTPTAGSDTSLTPTTGTEPARPGDPGSTTVTAEPGPDHPDYTPTPTNMLPVPPESTIPTPPPPTARPSPGAETGSPTPSEPPTAEASPSRVGPGNLFPDLPDKAVSCGDEVSELARMEPSLRGAAVTAERETDVGMIYLYETKEAWVVCDDSTAVPGGPQSEDGYTPTLASFHLKREDYRPTSQTLAISENWLGTLDNNGSAYFFAAARDFDGVQAISYTFPDGHTEEAVVGRNGLWSMSYLPTEGVLADPTTNTFRLKPIKVTVQNSWDDFSVTALEWGEDTCAQLNHGC